MAESRVDRLRAMVQADPGNPRVRFFLASELFRGSLWEEAAAAFEAYLQSGPDDPGSARKQLGLCYERLGRDADARATYRQAERDATEWGHAGLAGEVRQLLEDLGD